MLKKLILYCCIGIPSLLFAQKKVLIIGIDGLRVDALTAANTPNIDQLIATGTYSLDALTQAPTSSGPGWSSMLTGVWADKHNVYDNSFSQPNYAEYPHFFKRIKAKHPELKTASVVHWGPINEFIVEDADVSFTTNSDESVKNIGLSILSVQDASVLFLHFDDVDGAGHSYGFNPNISQYTRVVEQTDLYIGELMAAVETRSINHNEEWVIVVSTDHGGLGSSHGGASYEERNIFIIISGEGIPQREIKADTLSVSTTESAKGFAMEFVGNSYAQVSNLSLEPDDFHDFTIEMRVKVNGWSGDPSLLSNKNWNSGRNPGFVLAAQANGQSWKFNWGDGSNRVDLNGDIINDGEWHHIAVSLVCGGKATLYQDGREMASVNNTVTCDVGSSYDIAIAQDGTLQYPFYFPGAIDEIRIWNKALDAAVLEAWRCTHLTEAHPDYAALKAYWPIEGGTGNSLSDASGNGHTASVFRNPNWIGEQSLLCQSFEVSEDVPNMVDIAPTILALLSCEINESWGLDGQSLVPMIPVASAEAEDIKQPFFAVFPNPVHEQLSIISKGGIHLPFHISIVNVSGQECLHQDNIQNQSSLDLSFLQAGIYFYRIYDNRLNVFQLGKLVKL